MKQALEGVRILDLTMNLPGPYMTWVLAGLGAEVVKVENPKGGDYARALASSDGKSSPVFEMVNSGKKSVAIDLKKPAGKDIFLDLVSGYDVMVEGFRPGVMRALGLDFEACRARRTDLIYLSISGYGQTGPYRERAGHDLNYLSLAGIIGLNGTKSGALAIPGIQIADLAGGSLIALSSLLAALFQREKTGQGQFIDVSMFDGSFALNAIPLSTTAAGMDKALPAGMLLNGGFPFYGLYRTRDDRYMSLGAVETKFWNNFCQAVDRQDLISKQYGGPEIIREVEGIFSQKTQTEWIRILSGAEACCEPVLTLDETLESDLVKRRGLVKFNDSGHPCLTSPLRLAGTPEPTVKEAPGLGRHTRSVLSAAGVSKERIDELRKSGIIRQE